MMTLQKSTQKDKHVFKPVSVTDSCLGEGPGAEVSCSGDCMTEVWKVGCSGDTLGTWTVQEVLILEHRVHFCEKSRVVLVGSFSS